HVAGGSAGSTVRNSSVMFAEAYGRVVRSDEVHSHASGAGWPVAAGGSVASGGSVAAADRAISISRERNVGYRRLGSRVRCNTPRNGGSSNERSQSATD